MPLPKGYTLDRQTSSRLPPGYRLDEEKDPISPPQRSAQHFRTAMERMYGKGGDIRTGAGAVNAAGNTLSNVGSHIAGMFSGPYHAFADDPRSPEEQAAKGATSNSSLPARALGQLGLGVSRLTVAPTLEGAREAWRQRKAGNIGKVFSGEPYDEQGNYKPNMLSALEDAIPIAGPMARNFDNEAHTQGVAPAIAGLATDLAAPEAAAKVAMMPRFLKRAAQEKIAPEAALSTFLPDDTVTARQRYTDAKAQGVDLDLAQATNAAVPKATKAVTQHSFAGRGVYEQSAEHNMNQLQRHAERLLDNASPNATREQFGNRAKDVLGRHQQLLNDQAGTIYDHLSSRIGNTQPDATPIRQTAQKIIDANKDRIGARPDLLTRGDQRAWQIVQSLAKDAEVPDKTGVKLFGPNNEELAPEPIIRPDTWSDLHHMRSSLMDATRGPDLVGDQATGWLKQLTGSVDDAMTGAGSNLSPSDNEAFRNANTLYSRMKDRYDNPQSKFYHAARAQDGTRAASFLTDLTPAEARHLQFASDDLTAAGHDSRDFIPQLQRQTMDRMLRPTGDEVADLKNLPARFKRTQKEKLNGVLTPQQAGDMERLARTSKVVYGDDNPSGSGKLIQAVGDARTAVLGSGEAALALASGHPLIAAGGALPAAYALGSKVVADAVTSPARVEAAMAPKTSVKPIDVSPTAQIAAPTLSENEQRTEQEPAEAQTQKQVLHPEGRPALDTGYSQTTHSTPESHVFHVPTWQAAQPDEDPEEAKAAARAAGYEVVE